MFKKARNKSLVSDVVEQIEEAILANRFNPHDRLPSSRELQTIFGASLGTIREAIAILEQRGLVEVKKGAKGGIFVREASTEPVTQGLGLLIRQMKISPRELAEFREIVEGGMIRIVVDNVTRKDLRRLNQFRAKFRKCLNRGSEGWKDFLKTEVELRRMIISLAKNKAFEAVLRAIHDNIFEYGSYYLPGNNALIQEAYDDWMKILDAIESGDKDTAEKVTRDHIERFSIHLEEGRKRVETNLLQGR